MQAQQSELQSLLRLTESTEEGQGQDQPSSSFRSLVLERAIPHTLARYVTALFILPNDTKPEPQDSAKPEPRVSSPDDISTTVSAAALPQEGTDAQRQQPFHEGVTAPPLDPPGTATAASATQMQTEADSGGRSGVSEAGLNHEQAGNAERQAAGKEAALCEKGSEQWAKGIGMAGLPWALQLLAAFARGHQVIHFSIERRLCISPVL